MSAHSRAWIWCLATTIAVICIDLALQSLTPLDVTSIALFGVIPVGTLAMVALALSGFYMAGRSKRFEARLQDLIDLFVIALLLLVIPYLWAYMLFIHRAPTAIGFGAYLADAMTTANYRFYTRQFGDAPPVRAGDAAWFLMIIRIAASLAMARVIWGESRRKRWA